MAIYILYLRTMSILVSVFLIVLGFLLILLYGLNLFQERHVQILLWQIEVLYESRRRHLLFHH